MKKKRKLKKGILLVLIICVLAGYGKYYLIDSYGYKYYIVCDNTDCIMRLVRSIKNIDAKENNIELVTGKIITSDVFDPYLDDFNRYMSNYPNYEFVAMEMESFCLFYLAKKLQKKAACLLSIVDVIGKNLSATSEDREKSLKNMIKVALDSIL